MGQEKAVQYLIQRVTIRDRDWRYGHRDLDVRRRDQKIVPLW